MQSSAFLESLIQDNNYSGLELPPLWQVIYQESMRGHHLLFRPVDTERYEMLAERDESWSSDELTDEMERIAMRLVACPDLQAMVRIIDGLPDNTRRSLYVFYKRLLWVFQNYVKRHMN